MSYSVDFMAASSAQIEAALCARLETIRLARNMTQQQLASAAGVSARTIRRLENGEGTSLDTFVRVMMALNVQQNLQALLPDPSVRPIERIAASGKERQRARPVKTASRPGAWTWGDGGRDD